MIVNYKILASDMQAVISYQMASWRKKNDVLLLSFRCYFTRNWKKALCSVIHIGFGSSFIWYFLRYSLCLVVIISLPKRFYVFWMQFGKYSLTFIIFLRTILVITSLLASLIFLLINFYVLTHKYSWFLTK